MKSIKQLATWTANRVAIVLGAIFAIMLLGDMATNTDPMFHAMARQGYLHQLGFDLYHGIAALLGFLIVVGIFMAIVWVVFYLIALVMFGICRAIESWQN